VVRDPGSGPAVLVKTDGLVDLLGGEARATHRNFVTAKYPADCFAVDAELVAEFVDGGARLVSSDDVFGLVMAGLMIVVSCPEVALVGWLDGEFWSVYEDQRVRVVPR
jgi:hypothetical protein